MDTFVKDKWILCSCCIYSILPSIIIWGMAALNLEFNWKFTPGKFTWVLNNADHLLILFMYLSISILPTSLQWFWALYNKNIKSNIKALIRAELKQLRTKLKLKVVQDRGSLLVSLTIPHGRLSLFNPNSNWKCQVLTHFCKAGRRGSASSLRIWCSRPCGQWQRRLPSFIPPVKIL